MPQNCLLLRVSQHQSSIFDQQSAIPLRSLRCLLFFHFRLAWIRDSDFVISPPGPSVPIRVIRGHSELVRRQRAFIAFGAKRCAFPEERRVLHHESRSSTRIHAYRNRQPDDSKDVMTSPCPKCQTQNSKILERQSILRHRTKQGGAKPSRRATFNATRRRCY